MQISNTYVIDRTYSDTCVPMQPYIFKRKYIYIHIHIHVCVCVCVCVCVYCQINCQI